MIRFVYTPDYFASTTNGKTSVADPSCLSILASVYGLGEFYGIRSLTWVAARKFKELIERLSQPMYGAFRLLNLLAFIEAIRVVYTTTPDDDRVLRDSVIDYIPENLWAIFWLEEFRELVNRVPDFVEEAFGVEMMGEIE